MNILSHTYKTLYLALLLVLFGCVKEEWMPAPNPEQTQEILVSIPSESKGSDDTRATTSAIGNIAVCIFEDNAGVRGAFTSAVVGFNIAEQSPDVYKFTANLGVPKKKVHYVLVANHSKTDAEILALSEEDIPTWDAFNTYFTQAIEFNTATNETVNFPSKLVGQIPAIGHVIREAEAPKVPAVTLIRSVAKINVTSDKLVGYTLSSIHVNKYGTSFHTLYDEAKFNTADKKVTSVNIPTPLALHSNPVNIAGASGKEFSFYVPEFINDKIEHLNRCAVVVGLAKGGKTTYFRLDFAKTITVEPIEIKHLDILRNHEYKFDITNIIADGYTTVDEAFRNRSVNIKYDIVISGDDANEASYDGQNYISVSKSNFDNFADFKKSDFKVFTDAVDGWKVVSKPTWLSLTIKGGAELNVGSTGVTGATLSMITNSTADAAATVDGEVVLRAGRVLKRIKYRANFVRKLESTHSELYFDTGQTLNNVHIGNVRVHKNPDVPADYPLPTLPPIGISSTNPSVGIIKTQITPDPNSGWTQVFANIASMGYLDKQIIYQWGTMTLYSNISTGYGIDPTYNGWYNARGKLDSPAIVSAEHWGRPPFIWGPHGPENSGWNTGGGVTAKLHVAPYHSYDFNPDPTRLTVTYNDGTKGMFYVNRTHGWRDAVGGRVAFGPRTNCIIVHVQNNRWKLAASPGVYTEYSTAAIAGKCGSLGLQALPDHYFHVISSYTQESRQLCWDILRLTNPTRHMAHHTGQYNYYGFYLDTNFGGCRRLFISPESRFGSLDQGQLYSESKYWLSNAMLRSHWNVNNPTSASFRCWATQ